MGKIHLLDQSTINQIAAGEVIDRPVSVVKELTENSIDAGATAITVEIRDGGTSMVRVTDNGSGIAAEDLPAAFQRHSTSKIAQAADLLTISSLGFRGEALSSVAAVARVELITRIHSSLVGNRYLIEGGKELGLEEVGAPEGTTIIVRDLFYNTPARRKFLKTAATEAGYIHDMMGKIALSRPDISFRLIQNGQTRLHTAGNHNLKDVIYQVYGRELTRELIPISFKSAFFQIEGYIGKPMIARSSRAYEIYFINGRYIRSNLIHKAIEEGYRNFLMQHKFPFVVFNLIIDPEFTDVNVHPSKMELRFRNQEFLYEEITAAIRKTLTSAELSPDFQAEPVADPQEQKKQNKEQTPREIRNTEQTPRESWNKEQSPRESQNTEQFARKSQNTEQSVRESHPGNSAVSEIQSSVRKMQNGQEAEPVPENRPGTGFRENAAGAAGNHEKAPEPFETRRMEQMLKEEQASFEKLQILESRQQDLFEEKLLKADTLSRIKLVGQIFDTYWIAQLDDTFLIIDQHAAHEKVMYESIIRQLKSREYTTQQITPPLIVTLTAAQQEKWNELSGLLKEMGFEMEPFGGNEYAVYGMPDNLVGMKPEDLLDEILESSADKKRITPDAIYEKAASLACKAAVKGNQRLSVEEATHLIAQLVDLENPYTCPHGRPTMIKMTKYELEKRFKRVL